MWVWFRCPRNKGNIFGRRTKDEGPIIGLNLYVVRRSSFVHLRKCYLVSELSLSVSSYYITGAGLAHLAGLVELQTLRLWVPGINSTGLAHLAGLVALQTLELCGSGIDSTDAGLAHLAGLTTLRIIF